ncbi:hypothetical protein ACFFX0_04445 [Citricoccus parietis]|uniref:Uncharacterized protein n=1 Tax=Citricoccus parietis TaxID=592307 RepID=A0ABV5FUW3_9MICC
MPKAKTSPAADSRWMKSRESSPWRPRMKATAFQIWCMFTASAVAGACMASTLWAATTVEMSQPSPPAAVGARAPR